MVEENVALGAEFFCLWFGLLFVGEA